MSMEQPWGSIDLQIVGWIYDPDHSLPPGMYVDVPHLDCLLVARSCCARRRELALRTPGGFCELSSQTFQFINYLIGLAYHSRLSGRQHG
jgi:hypothetical protein